MADGEPGGWAVPTATDIAFAVAVISAFGRRLPTSLRAFLLTLAVADDFGGIIIIATIFAHGFNLLWLLAGLAGIAAFGWLVRAPDQPRTAVHRGGAVVVGGALVWDPRNHHRGRPRLHRARGASRRSDRVSGRAVRARLATVHRRFRRARLRLLRGGHAGSPGMLRDAFGSPIALGIILGLVLEKPIGIVSATLLGARLLRLHPDDRGAWNDLLAVSCTAGIGFTVSLLLNSLSFDGSGRDRQVRDPHRLAALGGTRRRAAGLAFAGARTTWRRVAPRLRPQQLRGGREVVHRGKEAGAVCRWARFRVTTFAGR